MFSSDKGVEHTFTEVSDTTTIFVVCCAERRNFAGLHRHVLTVCVLQLQQAQLA
jgi:hypothetical protein